MLGRPAPVLAGAFGALLTPAGIPPRVIAMPFPLVMPLATPLLGRMAGCMAFFPFRTLPLLTVRTGWPFPAFRIRVAVISVMADRIGAFFSCLYGDRHGSISRLLAILDTSDDKIRTPEITILLQIFIQIINPLFKRHFPIAAVKKTSQAELSVSPVAHDKIVLIQDIGISFSKGLLIPAVAMFFHQLVKACLQTNQACFLLFAPLLTFLSILPHFQRPDIKFPRKTGHKDGNASRRRWNQ